MKGFQQHNEYHRYDVLEHCVRAMETVMTVPENRLHMKMAALFHDVGKPLTYSEEDNAGGTSMVTRQKARRWRLKSWKDSELTRL